MMEKRCTLTCCLAWRQPHLEPGLQSGDLPLQHVGDVLLVIRDVWGGGERGQRDGGAEEGVAGREEGAGERMVQVRRAVVLANVDLKYKVTCLNEFSINFFNLNL